jgi:hypothetical protein
LKRTIASCAAVCLPQGRPEGRVVFKRSLSASTRLTPQLLL